LTFSAYIFKGMFQMLVCRVVSFFIL